jgi:hypothetical protein
MYTTTPPLVDNVEDFYRRLAFLICQIRGNIKLRIGMHFLLYIYFACVNGCK